MNKILSVLAAFLILSTTIVPSTFAQYGGGGRSSSINSSTPLLVRDTCPDGDFSGSMYDNECDADDDRLLDGGSIVDGFVFFDDNNNGSFDSNEDPIASAVVNLLVRSTRQNIGTDVTNSRGYYEFLNIEPGEYTISVTLPAPQVSILQSLISLFVSSVNAQTETATTFEFDVSIAEDGTVAQKNFAVERNADTTNGVSSVDGGNIAEDDTSDEEVVIAPIAPITTPTNNILDGMGSLDVTMPMQNTVNNFVVPTELPRTGASL